MPGIKHSLQRGIVSFGPVRTAAVMGLFIVFSVFFSVNNVRMQERQAVEESQRLSASYAAAFAEYCELAVFGADQVLQAAAVRYGAERLTASKPSNEISDWLRSKLTETRFLIGIQSLDDHGEANQNTLHGAPVVNRRLSSSFQHHSKEMGSELHFWGHVYMPSIGRETIEISRRIDDGNGRFLGVISGFLDPEFFSAFFRNVNLPQGSIIGLYGSDGQLLVSVPATLDETKPPNTKSEILNAALQDKHISSQQALTRFPLLVRVELPFDPILRQYRKLGVSYAAFVLALGLMATLIVLLVRTLSKRLRAEEQIRILSLALENSPMSVVITGADGRIEYVNPFFTRQTGLSRVQATQEYPDYFRSYEFADGGFERMWNALSQGHIWHGELKGKRKDGQAYWESVAIAPIKDETGEIGHFVSVREDISLRKRAEYDLLLAKEMAEQANRAKSAFLANMSHELRTPLNAIIGFAELLLNRVYGPLNERQNEALQDIHKGGRHLLDIINDVLDMSRIEAGRYELTEGSVDAGGTIMAAVRLIESRAAEHGVKIGNDAPPNLPFLWGDERAIKQVLLNILGNAVKFTPRGGSVRINAGRLEQGRLWIEIKDTGPGIAEDDVERLFQPFQQGEQWLTRQHEGTGLGLAISKKLMELHGGGIELRSQLGVGTSVRLFFPSTRVHDDAH